MKKPLFLKLALSLAAVFFTIMIMTTWWQYLFSGVFKNQYHLERIRVINEIQKIRLEYSEKEAAQHLETLLNEKRVIRLTECSGENCVVFGKGERKTFYTIHPEYDLHLQEKQEGRVNMILWETSFLLVILALAIAYLVWVIYREKKNQAERLEFLAMTTHELKHPISTVSLVLDSIRRNSIPAERRDEFIEKALSEVKVLNRSIENLLKIQEIEMDHEEGEQKSPAGECYRLMQESWELHRLNNPPRIEFRQNDEPGFETQQIRIAHAAFQMISNNLIENALLYSKEKVAVSLDRDSHGIYLQVTDRGLGFTESEKKDFQKLFYRSTRHAIQNIRGSGLGHYIIKGLIEKYHLKLELHSDGENCGTTFVVRFK